MDHFFKRIYMKLVRCIIFRSLYYPIYLTALVPFCSFLILSLSIQIDLSSFLRFIFAFCPTVPEQIVFALFPFSFNRPCFSRLLAILGRAAKGIQRVVTGTSRAWNRPSHFRHATPSLSRSRERGRCELSRVHGPGFAIGVYNILVVSYSGRKCVTDHLYNRSLRSIAMLREAEMDRPVLMYYVCD